MCVFAGFCNRIIVSLFLLNFRLHSSRLWWFCRASNSKLNALFSTSTVLFRSNWVFPWNTTSRYDHIAFKLSIVETRLMQTKTWKKFHQIFVRKIAERSFWLPLFVDITIDFDWIWQKIWFCVGQIDFGQAISFQWYGLKTGIRHFNHSIQKLCSADFKTMQSRIGFLYFFLYQNISYSYHSLMQIPRETKLFVLCKWNQV